MIQIQITIDDLATFLRSAKRATFAGGGPRVKRRHVRIYRFFEDEWAYEDRYTGNLLDTGMEIVRIRDYPIWTMCYRGGMMLEEHHLSAETFIFLREVLKLIPRSMPVRGPDCHSRGDWVYENRASGTLAEFSGTELIRFQEHQVYWRKYQGGFVRDKAYEVKVADHSSTPEARPS